MTFLFIWGGSIGLNSCIFCKFTFSKNENLFELKNIFRFYPHDMIFHGGLENEKTNDGDAPWTC